MYRKAITISFVWALILISCATTNDIAESTKWKPKYRFQLGSHLGGIVENTNMTVVPNAEVDAFSGATRSGANIGARVLLPLKRVGFEVGAEYMYSPQSFTYNDPINGYNGVRKLGVSQCNIPLTLNFNIFRKISPSYQWELKLGYLAQINRLNISDGVGNLPSYSTISNSKGAILGISATPFVLKNGTRIGFFVEAYRGSQAYQDFYNRTKFEDPGTSFFKYGFICQF